MKILEPIITDSIEVPTSGFRNYEENPLDPIQRRVKDHYYSQHQFQTVEFVKSMVNLMGFWGIE